LCSYWLLLSASALATDPQLLEVALNGTTVAMVRVDSGRIELTPQLLELAEQDASGSLSELTRQLTEPVKKVSELLGGETAYLALDLPYSPQRLQGRLLNSSKVSQAQQTALVELLGFRVTGPEAQAGDWSSVQIGMDLEPFERESPPLGTAVSPAEADLWQAGLEAAGAFPVQLVVVLPRYVRETFAEIDPQLPMEVGGGSGKALIGGLKWLSVGFDPKRATLRVVAQTDSPTTAEAVKSHLPKMLRSVLKQADVDQATSTMLLALVGLLQPRVNDAQVILSLEDPQQARALVQLAASAITAMAKPMAQSQTSNKLKQFGLAFHNYESAYRTFPTYAELKKNGKPSGLSWRVHILPFIEQVGLYEQFKLDEPWDSPHNIQLLEKMPEIYKPVKMLGSADVVPPFHTTYVAPIGEKTIFGQEKAVSFGQITDGTSNTILFVEVQPEHAIPWTSPKEYPFDPANPVAKLRAVGGQVTVVLADGAVIPMQADKPAEYWNALFSRNGGEVVRY
jgi:hypothetical protein